MLTPGKVVVVDRGGEGVLAMFEGGRLTVYTVEDGERVVIRPGKGRRSMVLGLVILLLSPLDAVLSPLTLLASVFTGIALYVMGFLDYRRESKRLKMVEKEILAVAKASVRACRSGARGAPETVRLKCIRRARVSVDILPPLVAVAASLAGIVGLVIGDWRIVYAGISVLAVSMLIRARSFN